jgi:hypothetical protein
VDSVLTAPLRVGGCPPVRARRSGGAFDARASATTWIVARGLIACGAKRRSHIVRRWRAQCDDGSRSLVTDNGCSVRIGRDAAVDPVRCALLEWLPLTHLDLAIYDGGLFREAPADSLSLLIRPPTVWSLADAVAAARLLSSGFGFEPEQFDAIERYAGSLLRPVHLDRVRRAAQRIEAQLPNLELPTASTIVAAGCGRIAVDDLPCRAVAARQLARYATSMVVARRIAASDG